MLSFSLKDYSRVIVDGSYFVNRFPDDLAQELSGARYYTSSSYKAECNTFLRHMSPEQKQVFTHNYNILSSAASTELEQSEDLWTDLRQLSRIGNPVLLITSNLLLIEKIVLRGLKLDIYNLHELVFMPHSRFGEYEPLYTCTQDPKADPPLRLFDSTAGELDVYDDSRRIRILQKDSEFREGTEAYLYRDLAEPQLLAKLFTPSYRSKEKLNHVKALQTLNNEKLHCSWATMPEQILYKQGYPVGYLMHRFSGLRSLEFGVKVEKTAEKKVTTILDWCVMLASQAAYLGVFGMYITDFSECNFLLPADDSEDRHIIFLDTDSICLNSYFGGRLNSDLDHWSIIDVTKMPQTTKADLIDMSTRLLFAEIFYIITAGQRPYIGPDQYIHDPTGGPLEESSWIRYIFPRPLLDLMDRVLMDAHRSDNIPSLDGMIRILVQTQQDLAEETPEMTYQSLRQRFDEGRPWSVNGLERGKRETPTEESPKPEPSPQGSPDPRKANSSKHRTVNAQSPFAAPRISGAVLEPQPMDVLRKVPKVRFSRSRASRWKREQQQDQEIAAQLRPWFYGVLFLSLLLTVVWLCMFADIETITVFRQIVRDWFERASIWWAEDGFPLIERAMERIRSLLSDLLQKE